MVDWTGKSDDNGASEREKCKVHPSQSGYEDGRSGYMR